MLRISAHRVLISYAFNVDVEVDVILIRTVAIWCLIYEIYLNLLKIHKVEYFMRLLRRGFIRLWPLFTLFWLFIFDMVDVRIAGLSMSVLASVCNNNSWTAHASSCLTIFQYWWVCLSLSLFSLSRFYRLVNINNKVIKMFQLGIIMCRYFSWSWYVGCTPPPRGYEDNAIFTEVEVLVSELFDDNDPQFFDCHEGTLVGLVWRMYSLFWSHFALLTFRIHLFNLLWMALFCITSFINHSKVDVFDE